MPLPHKTPPDVRVMLEHAKKASATWSDITPLSKNEWLCWITSGKRAETRIKRLRVARDKLTRGERRPCCFAGCPHRTKNS